MNEGAGPEPMSARRAEKVKVNREEQLEGIIRRSTELGDEDSRARVETIMHEWEQSEWYEPGSHPVEALVRHLGDEVMAVLAERTDKPERLSSVRIVTLDQEEMSARLRPLPDGSALVYLSDAAMSLCNLYAGYAAEAMVGLISGGFVRSLPRILRAQRRGGMGKDPAVLAGLLRYYFVNQRVYGLAAKLGHQLTPEAEEVNGLLTFQAVAFILGHEIAHHVLEHSPAPSGFSPADDLSACSDSESMEFEADLLGYRAAAYVGERAVAGAPRSAELAVFPEVGAALGALIGMLAIHGTEQGEFIRRGRTHPPAPARAARLIDQFGPEVRKFSQLFLGDLLWATQEATDFSENGRPFDFAWFKKTPQVDSPVPEHQILHVSHLDMLQCRSRPHLAHTIGAFLEDSPVPLDDAVRAALAGDARTALLGCGIPPVKADRFCDPLKALRFFTLVDAIHDSLGSLGVLDRDRRVVAIGIAHLLSLPLSEPERFT